jgi:hypothetical protein
MYVSWLQTSLLEAALEMDVGLVGNDPSAIEARKPPSLARDGRCRSVWLIAHREPRPALIEIGAGYGMCPRSERRNWLTGAVD